MKMNYREDHLIQATAADATIRLIAALTTNLVAEACDRHKTAPTASAALGRTLTGALLLGSAYKDLEYITLRFDCDGPVGGIVAEASALGGVRGYVRNPAAHLPPNAIGKLDVKGIVGAGMLHVIREAGFEIGLMKEPYYGSTPIVSGEIAEDIAHYLAISEQINSAVSLGVFVEAEQGRVTAAGAI
jgi:molecular chaperone Hsp33